MRLEAVDADDEPGTCRCVELKPVFADQEQTAMDIFNEDEVEVIIPLVEVAATQSLIFSEVTSHEDDSSSNNSLVKHSIATQNQLLNT